MNIRSLFSTIGMTGATAALLTLSWPAAVAAQLTPTQTGKPATPTEQSTRSGVHIPDSWSTLDNGLLVPHPVTVDGRVLLDGGIRYYQKWGGLGDPTGAKNTLSAYLILAALNQNPVLLETSPADYVLRFLPESEQQKYVCDQTEGSCDYPGMHNQDQYHNVRFWAGADETAKRQTKQDFLKDYRDRFLAAAPKLPIDLVDVSYLEQSILYDDRRDAFPVAYRLPGVHSIEGVTHGNVAFYYQKNIESDPDNEWLAPGTAAYGAVGPYISELWFVDEAEGQRKINGFRKLGLFSLPVRHDLSLVELISEFGTMGLQANLHFSTALYEDQFLERELYRFSCEYVTCPPGGFIPEIVVTLPAVDEIVIGTQTWATRNLDVSRFRNGDPIQEVNTNEEWKRVGNEGIPAWSYYENDRANGEKFGKLYNWFAVVDPRGLAPEGWHVPSQEEWITVVKHLGGSGGAAGSKMKSESGWLYDENATNESGFHGLPGGARNSFTQHFSDRDVTKFFFSGVGGIGYWWSSSMETTDAGYSRYLISDNGRVPSFSSSEMEAGLSVRVLRNSPGSAGGPDATKEIPTQIPDEIMIGSQTWTTKNLDVAHFRNGDAIPEAKTAADWIRAGSSGTPVWAHYDSHPEKKYQAAFNGEKYGKLYNWFAVTDPRGLAPEGWHVPSDDEWSVLMNTLAYGIPIPRRGRYNLIEGTERRPHRDGLNDHGFAGVAGGYRGPRGTFTHLGILATWWSATRSYSDTAWDRELRLLPNFDSPEGTTLRYHVSMKAGSSVRLLKDR